MGDAREVGQMMEQTALLVVVVGVVLWSVVELVRSAVKR